MHSQKGDNLEHGSLAQLNRASDYGSEGYRFESCRNHKFNPPQGGFFIFLCFCLSKSFWEKITVLPSNLRKESKDMCGDIRRSGKSYVRDILIHNQL